MLITYKAEGDSFQSDGRCDSVFTYQVYMRNYPAPIKYLSKRLSPLHPRAMELFDKLKDNHRQCTMDNLYNSAAFCKTVLNHPRKVICRGVA